jgi:hypothetical protein
MAFAKAAIEILDSIAGLPGALEVSFNPTEYSLDKGAQIAEINIPGIDSPILQFIRGQNEKLTLDLFFDTTHDGMGENARDVREQTNPFYQLVKIQSETHAVPRIRFVWGGLAFKAIVENIKQKFDLFSPLGVPLRATLSVTFREYKTLEEQIAEMNLQTTDHSQLMITQRGDTLSGIAAKYYGDPGEWRVIAEKNEIANPRKLPAGTRLILPRLEER